MSFRNDGLNASGAAFFCRQFIWNRWIASDSHQVWRQIILRSSGNFRQSSPPVAGRQAWNYVFPKRIGQRMS